MGKFINETGNCYGRLTVLRRAKETHQRRRREAHWWCRCDCGSVVVIRGSSLRDGVTRSCGCLQREVAGRLNRLPKGVAAFNSVVSRMKVQAEKRSLEWRLTDEQIACLTKQPCHYCGAEPAQIARHVDHNGVYVYNGIDRIDNNEGYTIDNVVPCCKMCNSAKSTSTVSEFESWIVRVYECLIIRRGVT